MGSRGARVVVALAITFAGAGLGRLVGPTAQSPSVTAQAGGSGSGGGSEGGSGSGTGESGSSGSGTTGGGGTGGDTGGGGGDGGTGSGSPSPAVTTPSSGGDGSSGFSGANGSSGSGSGEGGAPPDGGAQPGDGTGSTTPGTVAAPATTAPVPEEDVRPGTPTDCPSDASSRVRCYRVDRDARGVRVPDGKGGSVVVALPDATPIVDVDTGASTSASSNVEVEIEVDIDRGVIVGVDQRDRVRQAVLATLALLMLVAAAFAAGALFMRRQHRNGGAA